MTLDLLIASFCIACGQAIFGHFEERTPAWRRLLKILIALGIVALLSWQLGSAWALGFLIAFGGLGLTVHFAWTAKHGINPWTAQPRDRYYKLRGWR